MRCMGALAAAVASLEVLVRPLLVAVLPLVLLLLPGPAAIVGVPVALLSRHRVVQLVVRPPRDLLAADDQLLLVALRAAAQ